MAFKSNMFVGSSRRRRSGLQERIEDRFEERKSYDFTWKKVLVLMLNAFAIHRKIVYGKQKKNQMILKEQKSKTDFVAHDCICDVKPRPFNITAALDSALSASILSNSA